MKITKTFHFSRTMKYNESAPTTPPLPNPHPHTNTLGPDVTLRVLHQCLMPSYACRFRTSTLIMVPINFWRDSDPFKKKEHFSSSKIDRVRAFLINLSKFQ